MSWMVKRIQEDDFGCEERFCVWCLRGDRKIVDPTRNEKRRLRGVEFSDRPPRNCPTSRKNFISRGADHQTQSTDLVEKETGK